jgi:hypothetical protein
MCIFERSSLDTRGVRIAQLPRTKESPMKRFAMIVSLFVSTTGCIATASPAPAAAPAATTSPPPASTTEVAPAAAGVSATVVVPPAEGAAPLAADNGQGHMKAALASLQQAKTELAAASNGHGGYRVQAEHLVDTAIQQVNDGIAYADAHPTDIGTDEGTSEQEPVDGDVKGAEHQPHMANALVDLREARKQLYHASHDKGGYRAKAIDTVNQAITAIKQGIEYGNRH